MKWTPAVSSGTPAPASTTAASWVWGRRSESAPASCTPTVQWACASSPAHVMWCAETARSAHEQGRKQENDQKPLADRIVAAPGSSHPSRIPPTRHPRRGLAPHRSGGGTRRPGEEGGGRGGEGADRARAPRDRHRGAARGTVDPARLRRRGGARLPRRRPRALRLGRSLGRRAAHRDGVKIRLLSVGKDKGPTAELAEEYAERIRRFADLEFLELRAADPAREAGALLDKARGELWALDERGTSLTSPQLAQRLGKLRDSAQPLTLCIGGDEGLAQPVRDAARFVWSLSALTLPHRLARVVALEQLYRSFEILRGGPYHK